MDSKKGPRGAESSEEVSGHREGGGGTTRHGRLRQPRSDAAVRPWSGR